jgi:protein dispatched 1
MDAYKLSAHSDDPEVLEDLESRMSWVYRRTGSAMFITSATTCAAFLCTLITPLVDIRSFGIFAAIVIFMDYVLVMTLFCTAVVIYHNKFERPGCCSSCTSGCRTLDPSTTTTARDTIDNRNKDEMDRVSRFFRNSFAPFIGAPMSRLVIAILFVAWMVVATSTFTLSTARTGPSTYSPCLLRSLCASA